MRKIDFAPDEYYHLYNRGVDKRVIFVSDEDKDRFCESIYLFNDKNHACVSGNKVERGSTLSCAEVLPDMREHLVSILAFKLMHNHYHILVREELDGGISEFMHRLGTGYTNFFNMKYNRTGSLFGCPFEAVRVESDSQLTHTIRYIHLNELDNYDINWRNGEIVDWSKAIKVLDEDVYSSHAVYCNKSQKLPIINEELANSIFLNTDDYLKFLQDWSQRSFEYLPHGLIGS
jgi:putative transposase